MSNRYESHAGLAAPDLWFFLVVLCALALVALTASGGRIAAASPVRGDVVPSVRSAPPLERVAGGSTIRPAVLAGR